MRKPEMRNLERLRHWQGEKLKRADFADQAAYDARRAAWHNRSLHETFGIVAGLQVSIAAGKVSVTPGLAYDAQGNPLWLARATEMHLPTDVADRTYYLVLGVPRGCGCRCPESGAGFEWAPESEWMSCDGLPLAVTTADGALSPCEPKRIRALERPRLASGETIRGRTPWELWEVSAPGQTAKIQAGVQTRIDTSSSGFTTTPHYFASLRAPVWSSSGNQRPEFAPTYLAHVANPTPDGFTFRLLLKDIALRSFGVARTVARVRALGKPSFERLEVELEAPSAFLPGDTVALVRPRGTRASAIRASDEELLQLDATLGLAPGDRVALGNLPRYSRVQESQTTQQTRIQPKPGAAIASGVVVGYIAADGTSAVARVVSTDAAGVLLDRQWALPEAEREFRSSKAGVKPVRVTAGPVSGAAEMKVEISRAGRISEGDWVVALPPTGQTLSAPVRVTAAAGTEVTLAPPIAGLAKNHRLLPLTEVFTVTGTATEAGAGVAQLDTPGGFAEGDLVGVAERPSSLAIVLRIDGNQVTLETGENFSLNANEHLVAANWEAATTLLSAFPSGGKTLLPVSDSSFFQEGDLLLKWPNPGGPATPVEPRLDQLTRIVNVSPGWLVTQSRIAFARGEVVLAARFPLVTSFVAAEAGNRVRVAAAGLRAGDWIAPLDTPGEFRIAQLREQIAPDLFVAASPLDDLAPGTPLGVVHFGPIGEVASAQTGDPPNSIRLEEPAAPRATGDFVARWSHFFDNAPFSVVEQSVGDRIVLSAPNRFAGDGVVPDGLIDGGVLALAALTLNQRGIRLDAGEVMTVNAEITASGKDPLENDRSVPMSAAAFDAASSRVTLDPRVGVQSYSFRPERLNLLSAFNESFPEQFAVFAQRQGLYVCWTAWQDADRSDLPLDDPPAAPCGEPIGEDPCPCQA